MYSLGIPVSKIRTKIRQEFERHRYVNSLPAVDVLLTQSHMEFQVGQPGAAALGPITRVALMDPHTGDTQLLEATNTCHEVFQTRRGSESEISEKLHCRFP
jgi:hypothetical protein